MSDKLKVKSLFVLFFLVSSLFILSNCDRNPVTVTGQLPAGPEHSEQTETTPAQKPVFAYGNYFHVYNSNLYKQLLESCRRCGVKRVIQGPFGQTQYQKFWTSHGDPKRCDSWSNKGYIQIEFIENRLPTTAKVLILPQYSGYLKSYNLEGKEQDIWGEAFEITATARPINENKGFEILVSPADGLLGIYNLVIKSDNANPVTNYSLPIQIRYGHQSGSQTVISGTVNKLDKRAVETPKFTCSQYTN